MVKNIPVAPLNVVYVQIKKKLYDSIRFDSGLILYKDTVFHPEEASMCEATVVSLPRAIQDRFDYYGMSTKELALGNTILIRYDVVFHYVNQPERDSPVFRNMLLYNGEEYWRVDIQQIFGILRKGYVDMINGYVMCDLVEERVDLGRFYPGEHFSTRMSNELYKIRYIGKHLPDEPRLYVRPGDRVHIRPGIAQRYQTDWGIFSIIKQSHILAAENMA